MRKVFGLILIAILITSATHGRHIRKRRIKKLFRQSVIVNDHFTGFALYDLDEQQMIYELNAAKYFTPASNTKLFTFYTCLKILGDSIPALKYQIKGDSLIFWGTGDPTFLHSDLKGVNGFNLLKKTTKKLFFATGNYQNDFYGAGWAWDDYNDYYQAEITELPLEDNVAILFAGSHGKLQVKPAYLNRFLKCDSDFKPNRFQVKRDFLSNTLTYPATPAPLNYQQQIPLKTSSDLTIALLEDTLKKDIKKINLHLSHSAKTIYNANADSVYRHMLQQSDNFMAEQLLLVCSSVKFNTLNADSIIAYSKQYYLNDLPDEPQWVDGSGLSRRNLFTPRTIISLLNKIMIEFKNENLLHSLLPVGGVAGTIKNAYKTDKGSPFVWAKTGSLSNNHNQSGYLITRKGKRLAFSFMNNNFTRPSSEIRNEMVRIMTFIHENF